MRPQWILRPLIASLLLTASLHPQPGKVPKGDVHAAVTRFRSGPIGPGGGGSWGRAGVGWYDPFLWEGLGSGAFYPYSILWPNGYWLAASSSLPAGTARFRVTPPQARVTIEGAFAGSVDELNDLRLTPGACLAQFGLEGSQEQQQEIYVMSGKTMRLDVTLRPEPQGEKP